MQSYTSHTNQSYKTEMRILHVFQRLYRYGGSYIAARNMAQAQAESGHEVAILSTAVQANERLEVPDDIQVYLADISYIASRMPIHRKINVLLEKIYSDFMPDVVHLHGVWDTILHKSAVFFESRGIPLIQSTHGLLMQGALREKSWKKHIALALYQRRDLRRVAAFHTTSKQETSDLRCMGITAHIKEIPLSIPTPTVSEDRYASMQHAPKRLLFLSRIYPIKGVLPLIRAWHAVQPTGWELMICGPDDGGHLKEVTSLVQELGLESTVLFHGAVQGEEKEQMYKSADLFILPSYSENFGMAVLEALSYGIPVLTTQGTPWKIIEDYQAGSWFSHSPSNLEQAIKQYTAMPKEGLITLSNNALRLYHDHFSSQTISDKLIALYSKRKESH
ncbi:glycosyltransferase [Porphyromonas loveana]